MSWSFDVLLLDLNSTFMFGEDRFGPDEDYAATCARLGGPSLSQRELGVAIAELVETMTAIGRRPDRYDSFPTVRACLGELDATKHWSRSHLEVVEEVVALHELGSIPPEYARIVSRLAESHRLGLVSNLWSEKGPWLRELERAGLAETFEWLVFSSDGTSIKPSSKIFAQILEDWRGDRGRVLMVGDSLRRDVAGARAAGIRSLWIDRTGAVPAGSPTPDYWISDLLALPSSGVLA